MPETQETVYQKQLTLSYQHGEKMTFYGYIE